MKRTFCSITLYKGDRPVESYPKRVKIQLKKPTRCEPMKERILKRRVRRPTRHDPQTSLLVRFLNSVSGYIFGVEDKENQNVKVSYLPDLSTRIRLFNKILLSNKKLLIAVPRIDKYIIAMSFVYLHRARLTCQEYSTENWLLALHIAWDMEEDEPSGKHSIVRYAIRVLRKMEGQVSIFFKRKDNLWKRMRFRTYVPLKSCIRVVELMPALE